MTAKYKLSIFAGIAIALGSAAVSAGQTTAPYYDEDTDTVVYNFVGHPTMPEESLASSPAAAGITPYYDEDTDTVVYNFVSRPIMQVNAMADIPE